MTTLGNGYDCDNYIPMKVKLIFLAATLEHDS